MIFVHLLNKVENKVRTGGVVAILFSGIIIPFFYIFGWPVMLWIQWRDLWNMIEDDIRLSTYSYRTRGEAVDWKSEGF